ncbi:MAG: hypothetical protein NT105_12155 [Verrucomicrobia bacterium]|nr:hypothetical protein [Verrucomicrobiota bacterium]
MTIVLAKGGLRWKIVSVMTARFAVAAVVIGLVGVCQSVCAQGKNFAQPYEQKRMVNIITPGSLYRNQSFNQSAPGTFNKPIQSGNRSSSTMPQKAVAQPLDKPVPLNTLQQQSSFATPSKTTTPQISSFEPLYKPLQSTPQTTLLQQPVYTMGQQSVPPPSPYSGALPITPFSSPAQQPIYSVTPQFTTALPLSYGAQPNTSLTPPTKPIYTLEQQPTVPQHLPSGTASMIGSQRTPALQSPYVPLSSPSPSAPLASPLVTPLAAPRQQPFYIPESPLLQQQPPARR